MIISMLFSHIKINKELAIDYIVYLRTTPVNAYNRCRVRNRKGETVEFSYIDSCHNMYESWLNKAMPNLVTLDCDDQKSEQMYQAHIKTIQGAIKNETPNRIILKTCVVLILFVYWYVMVLYEFK